MTQELNNILTVICKAWCSGVVSTRGFHGHVFDSPFTPVVDFACSCSVNQFYVSNN